MLSWIREKFGTVVISGIIGFIAFVFLFYGVFSPKSTQGLHEGAVAGLVNGDAVTLSEFNREYNRRVEMYKEAAGGKLTEEQLEAFRLRETVFDDLARRKLMVQEVKRQNLVAPDDQVMEAIRAIPAFQKENKFDIITYRQVLEANQYSPGVFENLVRDDLSAQLWDRYFTKRVWVSNEEVKQEYQVTEDKRKLKYVLLTTEAARKLVDISSADVQKYLGEPAKLNLIKSQYESKKETVYKGKTLDDVKESIARDLIAGDKMKDVQKASDELATKVVPLLQVSAGSDAAVNALLKTVGAEVKTTDWLARTSPYVPGVGDVSVILKDAFSQAGLGSQAKKYSVAAGTLIVVVTEVQKPDFAKFETKREELFKKILQRKQQDLYQAWISGLSQGAKIKKNAVVLGLEKS